MGRPRLYFTLPVLVEQFFLIAIHKHLRMGLKIFYPDLIPVKLRQVVAVKGKCQVLVTSDFVSTVSSKSFRCLGEYTGGPGRAKYLRTVPRLIPRDLDIVRIGIPLRLDA